MAELLVSRDGFEAWHAHWGELATALVWRGLRADLLWVDAPYSARTHRAHDDGADMQNRGQDELRRGGRRKLSYAPWTPRDVRAFVRTWAPLCAGWFVTITDHCLLPWWEIALRRAGLYVFAPIAYVAPGSRVRRVGDGPPTWCNYVVHARPRTREFARWGTAEARAARGNAPSLLGAYVLPPGEGGAGKLPVVGGKPAWLHEAVVSRYSAPGGLVVDPCAGGGGAARAARRLGRRAIVGDVLREHAELCAAALDDGVPSAGEPPSAVLDADDRQASLPYVTPGSVGPGTPEQQSRHRGCDRNRLHPYLMLGRACACGYEGRA